MTFSKPLTKSFMDDAAVVPEVSPSIDLTTIALVEVDVEVEEEMELTTISLNMAKILHISKSNCSPCGLFNLIVPILITSPNNLIGIINGEEEEAVEDEDFENTGNAASSPKHQLDGDGTAPTDIEEFKIFDRGMGEKSK